MLHKKGRLEAIPPELLVEIENALPTQTSREYYTKLVKDQKILRDLHQKAQTIVSEVGEKTDAQEYLSSLISEFSALAAKPKSRSIREIVQDFEAEQERNTWGIQTGNAMLDTKTKGIEKGHFWILAAYSGSGKTMLALQMVRNALLQNKSVAFYSLEMRDTDIYERLKRIQTHDESNCEDILDWRISIITDKRSWSEIAIDAQLREPDLVVVDFAQIVSCSGKSEYERMQNLAHSIQNFTKKTNIPIFLLSQISNETAKNDTYLPNAKGGGDLFAACDVFIDIRRKFEKEQEQKKAQPGFEDLVFRRHIYLSKNRFGPEGAECVAFDATYGKGLYKNF